MFFVTTARSSSKSSTSKLSAKSAPVFMPLVAQATTPLRSDLGLIPLQRKTFDSDSPLCEPKKTRGILKRQKSHSTISSSSDYRTGKSVRFSDCAKAFDAGDDPSMNISRPRGMQKHMGVVKDQSSNSSMSSSPNSRTRKSVRFSDCTKAFDAVDDPSIDISLTQGMRKHMGFPEPGSEDWFDAQRTGKYESCYASVNTQIKLARSQSHEPAAVARPLGIPRRKITVGARSAPARMYDEYTLSRVEHAIADILALL